MSFGKGIGNFSLHWMNCFSLDDTVLTGECISLRAVEGAIATVLLPLVLGE